MELLSKDKDGNTVLHHAAQQTNHSYELLTYLIPRIKSKRANLAIANSKGENFFHVFIQKHSTRSVDNAKFYELFKLISSKTIDIFATDAQKRNILHYIAENANILLLKTLVRFLLDKPAAKDRLKDKPVYSTEEERQAAKREKHANESE